MARKAKEEGTFPHNRVREWRERRGMSMAELAEKMPFKANASQINKIEKRHQSVDLKWLLALAEALDLNSPGDLLVWNKPGLSEQALDVAHKFQGLSEPDRQVAHRMIDSLAGTPVPPEKND
ncbi:MAG: helix-turn-helix transcriptional regulator [Alphaproteobacteria bacterium]|nr:helix-turn-helix transcriptional regulator [Alphaproteobacteria bacterium]